MRQLSGALIACTTLALLAGSAQAGPCTDQIAQFEKSVQRSGKNLEAGPTAPTSTAAKLHRQPTAQSVKEAKEAAQSRFADLLARAKDLDAKGDRAACMQALNEAKLVYSNE